MARRAAMGTGLLVVGAVALFAAVQQREVAGMEPPDRPTAASTSVRDPAPDAVGDAPARDVVPPPLPPTGAEPSSDGTGPSSDGTEPSPEDARPPGSPGPDPILAGERAESRAQPLPSSDLLALGERIYREQRCAACHSIAGVGSPRSPLDGVGSRLTASEIRLWIVDPQAMRPGIRKPAFSDLPPDEVEALVAFIQGLR